MDALDDVTSDEISDKLCDLTAWRVTIPKIRAKPEPDNQRKHLFVFCIEVHRVDITEGVLSVSAQVLVVCLYLTVAYCNYYLYRQTNKKTD